MAPHKNSNQASQGEGNNSSPTDPKQGGKNTDVYKKRRERNNIAVRKSRQLSRQKAKLTDEKVNQLREENQQLEERVKLLNKELSVLKDLFFSSAGPVSDSVETDSGSGQSSSHEK